MTTINKIIWTLGLLCAFLIILLTGQTNVKNFEQVQNSMEEIYRDRLVVKGLIFELSSTLHEKELALVSKNNDFYLLNNEAANKKIENLITQFRATNLTSFEERTLNHFESGIVELRELEGVSNISKGIILSPQDNTKILDNFSRLRKDLKTLSEIQLNEGKRKLSVSDRAMASINTFTVAESYILLVFAVLMFSIIFIVPGPKNKKFSSDL